MADEGTELAADRRIALERLWELVQQLKPPDRQIILLYLEDMDAASIGEITGVSPGNIATKIHRIKNVMAYRFQEGAIRGN
jgi:RNA polymerase sigma-70 factor (ECF subfamily)